MSLATPPITWWSRLPFLFALSTSVALTFLTLMVALSQIVLVADVPPPVYARDVILLALAGCALLMATTHVLRDELAPGDRSTAIYVAGSGMLIIPSALAVYLLA